MNNIIVTLTTVPDRLFSPDLAIQPSLETIVKQNCSVEYEVHLNVPYQVRGIYIDLPEWLFEWQKKYNNFKVFRCKDKGPITKIYPTLKRIHDPTTMIITVDDDLMYCDGFIEAHISARRRYEEYAIGYAGMGSVNESKPADSRGVHPTGPHHFVTSLDNDYRVRFLEGYKTISYMRSFFSEDLIDLEEFIDAGHWNDDVILSAYMGYKNVKKIVLKCENCEGDYSPRVETFPVIGHLPIGGDSHGCNFFRRKQEGDEDVMKNLEKISNNWYSLGYLER